MIKTATGTTINCEDFSHKLNEKLLDYTSSDDEQKVSIKQADDCLVILISPQQAENIDQIVDLVKETIEETEIINDFVICDSENESQIYFVSNEGEQTDADEDNVSEESAVITEKRYTSVNFSSGFVIFILGVLSIASLGVFYYISRPCVVDKCALITENKSTISQLLKNQSNENLNAEQIKDLKLQLTNAIQELKRIPHWSDYHEQANQLITQYQVQIEDLNYFLKAFTFADKAQNLSQQLPLNVKEWNRVQDFYQQAIAQLEPIKSANFAETKVEKIAKYLAQINQAKKIIAIEAKGETNLAKAQEIVNDIQAKSGEAKQITDLEAEEKQWQNAIQAVESIPVKTVSALKKEELLNNYLVQIIEVQEQIKQEKSAEKEIVSAKENIKLAQESQANNQWSKAVSYWQKVIISLGKVSSESLFKEEKNKLTKSSQEKLTLAQVELKKAIKREEIKAELKAICVNSENICSYNVSDRGIQIFLNKEYFDKITSLSTLSNSAENVSKKRQLVQHIEQVENNYKYLQNKYNLPVQVYNHRQSLIMMYY